MAVFGYNIQLQPVLQKTNICFNWNNYVGNYYNYQHETKMYYEHIVL